MCLPSAVNMLESASRSAQSRLNRCARSARSLASPFIHVKKIPLSSDTHTAVLPDKIAKEITVLPCKESIVWIADSKAGKFGALLPAWLREKTSVSAASEVLASKTGPDLKGMPRYHSQMAK